MKFRFIFFFIFFTFLFLFYPGNNYYFNLFKFHSNSFIPEKKEDYKVAPIPFVKDGSSPFISAQGAYITDLDCFTPIFEKQSKTTFLPASTTKIITALVVFDVYKMDSVLTVKRLEVDGQLMGLVPGERLTVENLLYGMLVHSGNDAALVFADNYPLGYDAFIQKMNEKAKVLDMKNSHFTNPVGFDDINQYTTPFDLSLAGRKLLENKFLAKIVSTKTITISDVDFKYFHQLENVNKLLGEIPGIGGLKTGYTEDAKENLVSFYKKNGHQFLIVILKSDDRFLDTTTVIDWINNSIDYSTYASNTAGT